MSGGYILNDLTDEEKLEHWKSQIRFWESIKRAYDTNVSKQQISYYKKIIKRLKQ